MSSSPPPPMMPSKSSDNNKTSTSITTTSGSTIPRFEAAQDAVIKVLVLGDAATGKTSIIRRYVHDMYSEHHKTTVGVDFALKAVTVDNTTLRLQLWDIAGQEQFRALNRVYYKDALGALLCYDISRPNTFENVVKWKREIDSKVELPNGKQLPVILIGNKCDLVGDVDRSFLDTFCQTNGFVGWFETSAKKNININEAAQCIAHHILQHRDIFEVKREKRGETLLHQNMNQKNSNDGTWGCCNSF